MKRTIFTAMIILSALLTFSCDRFKHSFEPPEVVDFEAEVFTPLQEAFDQSATAGLEPIMSFYAADYMHFGQNKADRHAWLESIYSLEPDAVATVTLLDAEQISDSTAIANWNLRIASPEIKTVFADSTFVGEGLVKRNGAWLLKGNQMTCVPETLKQRIIIEYFTFLGCPNCPPVEAELHDLQLTYPNQLSYLEHHTSGPLLVPGDETFSYYGPFTVPTSIFQGETLVIGSGQDVIDNYAPLALTLSQQDSAFRYFNPVISVEGQTISGSITLDPQIQDFNYQDLVLTYVLIERVSSYNNTQGVPLRNVVRAKGSLPITASDMNTPLVFSLQSATQIPEDASLVIFAQTKPAAFTNNATIHSGIEIALDRKHISFK